MIKIYSWKKAYITSFLIHIACAAVLLVAVQGMQTKEKLYVINLEDSMIDSADTTSVGGGGLGGSSGGHGKSGGGDSYGAKGLHGGGAYHGSGLAVGGTIGQGNGTGRVGDDGRGKGPGNGGPSSDNPGGGPGEDPTGHTTISFDTAGFRAAVNANKRYPKSAIRRGIEGVVVVDTMLDSVGNCIGVSVVSSSGYDSLDDAAVAAAQAACPYPNESGDSVSVSTRVIFSLQ